MSDYLILLLSEFFVFLSFFPIFLELVDLPLVKFDFSCNKVLVIPICFREMKQLQVLLLENNPLQSPPAQVRFWQMYMGYAITRAQATLGRASFFIFCLFNFALDIIISSHNLQKDETFGDSDYSKLSSATSSPFTSIWLTLLITAIPYLIILLFIHAFETFS